MFRLRQYQEECLESIRFGHQEYDSIAIELATGLGKTVIFSKYASHWNDYATDRHRCMVIAPQLTLIGQAARKLEKETGMPVAIEQGELLSNEEEWARCDFVVASKQSLASRERYKRFRDIGLVVVDEAHYAATESYGEILNYFKDLGAKVLGVSATLNRHDRRAMGQIFEHCVYQYGIAEGISEGYLVPLSVKVKQLTKLDLSKVGERKTMFGTDYATRELNEKIEDAEVIYEIAEAVAQETRGEKTAVFCASVEEARAVAELLEDQYQMPASWICADTKKCPKKDREERLAEFTTGGLTHLCNVGILTTGWDFPALQCVVMARPTKSRPLYTQMVGRVTRPIEGPDGRPVIEDGATSMTRQEAIAGSTKPHGRVIDLVDTSLTHSLVTAADVLGGRWTLGNPAEDSKEFYCRFCQRVFASRGMLGIHVLEDHPDKALSVQNQSDEEIRDEDAAIHAALRAQRATIKANAEFRDQEVDPFRGDYGRGRNRKQRDMATDAQRRYLYVLGWKSVDSYAITKAQASRCIGILQRGGTVEGLFAVNRFERKE